MNQPRFYCRAALSPGAHVELPEPVARHAVRVLRLGVGATLTLFDGRGGEYPAQIERIERDRVFAELGAWVEIERESPLSVTLVQALQAGRADRWKSHCEVVIAANPGGDRTLYLIGGNVANTVIMRKLSLDQTGKLELPNVANAGPGCSPGRAEACNFNRQDWAALLKLSTPASDKTR